LALVLVPVVKEHYRIPQAFTWAFCRRQSCSSEPRGPRGRTWDGGMSSAADPGPTDQSPESIPTRTSHRCRVVFLKWWYSNMIRKEI